MASLVRSAVVLALLLSGVTAQDGEEGAILLPEDPYYDNIEEPYVDPVGEYPPGEDYPPYDDYSDVVVTAPPYQPTPPPRRPAPRPDPQPPAQVPAPPRGYDYGSESDYYDGYSYERQIEEDQRRERLYQMEFQLREALAELRLLKSQHSTTRLVVQNINTKLFSDILPGINEKMNNFGRRSDKSVTDIARYNQRLTEIEQGMEENKLLGATVTSMEQKTNRLDNMINEHDNKLLRMENTYRGTLARLETRLSQVESNTADQVYNMEESVLGLEKEVKKLAARPEREDQATRIAQLKRQLFDTNNKATYLERQISSNDRDIAKTDQKVKEVLRMMQYQDQEQARAAPMSIQDDYINKVSQLEQQFTQDRSRVTSLDERCNILERQLGAYSQAFNQIKTKGCCDDLDVTSLPSGIPTVISSGRFPETGGRSSSSGLDIPRFSAPQPSVNEAVPAPAPRPAPPVTFNQPAPAPPRSQLSLPTQIPSAFEDPRGGVPELVQPTAPPAPPRGRRPTGGRNREVPSPPRRNGNRRERPRERPRQPEAPPQPQPLPPVPQPPPSRSVDSEYEGYPIVPEVSRAELGEIKPIDCSEIYDYGLEASGVYYIYPSTLTEPENVPVYCDMTTNGGGWTVFQRRLDGRENFNRNFSDYRKGFGTPVAEYWLGNNILHHISHQDDYALMVELEDWEGNIVHANYDQFTVGDASLKYRLNLGRYSGTAGDSIRGNMLSGNNRMPFSTYDEDNDKSRANCATTHKGGWWYNQCGDSNLNGVYYSGGVYGGEADGIYWYSWKQDTFYSLKRVEMKIRPTYF
ncbi:uncharacterized protein LOC118412167 [Branchiostoma floridae]|uniref:Uncharacterized protein LOC118412167 n=2 Tax=Branchiostoma floridae TaxID=7739 RepID=A0A9J7KVY4_BRAFL|nr:uncharacterized protein LOC118412167 [Branchiostoma floridae]